MTRDWHGIARAYVRDDHVDDDVRPALRDLVRAPLALDRHGVLAAWGVVDDPLATVVAGVRQLACRQVAEPASFATGEAQWLGAFERAVAAIATSARAPVLALGGGIDAAAVLLAWRASGVELPAVCTLATGLADYDETAVALAIAGAVGVRCDVVHVSPAALVGLAPEAAVAAETPLYNLHPVHRLALAAELRRRGFATLVTGDGADAVCARVPDLDYVPIVAALAHHAGLALASPFFADAVVDGTPRDPAKRLVRDYVRARGFGELADRPKRARMLPALDLTPILDGARISQLARSLELPALLADDRARVGWATLDHLARSLEPG